MKIAIIGLGCVATADALALARSHEVVMTGPVPDRVDAINQGEYGLEDPCLETYLASHSLDLKATLDTRAALANADMVFISSPLAADPDTGAVRLVELDSRIELANRLLPFTPIVVRSAVPVGYCEARRIALKGAKIVFAPEFSRTGHMLTDVLHPKFLIVGDEYALGAAVLAVLKSAAVDNDVPSRQLALMEAESLRNLADASKARSLRDLDAVETARLPACAVTGKNTSAVWRDPRMTTHSQVPSELHV